MQTELDAYTAAFLKSVEDAKALGFPPSTIIQMLADGQTPYDITVNLMTASAKSGRPQAGFIKLLRAGRVDLTIEALMVSPAHSHLFAQTHALRQLQLLADARIKSGGAI